MLVIPLETKGNALEASSLANRYDANSSLIYEDVVIWAGRQAFKGREHLQALTAGIKIIWEFKVHGIKVDSNQEEGTTTLKERQAEEVQDHL